MAHLYLEKEIKYERKEAIASLSGRKIRAFIYKILAKHYENRYNKYRGF